jgi:hypothetical protein
MPVDVQKDIGVITRTYVNVPAETPRSVEEINTWNRGVTMGKRREWSSFREEFPMRPRWDLRQVSRWAIVAGLAFIVAGAVLRKRRGLA